MAKTSIEWAAPPGYLPESWNAIRARYDGRIGWHCEKVSPGCRHCYSERQNLAGRFGGTKLRYTADSPAEVYLDQRVLEQPLHWREPRCVFVCSMSDLFLERVALETVAAIYAAMALAPDHRFLVLTKRPERARQFYDFLGARPGQRLSACLADFVPVGDAEHCWLSDACGVRWPPPNVGLGVTVEGPEYRDRLATLSEIPAAMRFVSCEPLLERTDLAGPLCLEWSDVQEGWMDNREWVLGGDPRRGIDWVIAGGESGPGARPAAPDWFRSLRDQCQASAVPFFFKQWGEWRIGESRDLREYVGDTSTGQYMVRVGKKRAGRLLDWRTWDQWPTPFFATDH